MRACAVGGKNLAIIITMLIIIIIVYIIINLL